MYENNHQNDYFYDLRFDGDHRLISGHQIYRVNDDVIERLNNGSIIYIYINRM